MGTRVKLILATLMLIMGSALGALGSAPVAAAAQTCTWSGCNGKNPQTYGCTAGSQTISQGNDGYGNLLELRYSSRCHAVWTRGSSGNVVAGHVVIRSGFVDYYGTWHQQKEYKAIGADIECACIGWTGMISIHGYERYKFGRDDMVLGQHPIWTWINTIDGCPDSTCH